MLFGSTEESSEVLAMLVLGVKELLARDLGFLYKRTGASSEDAFAPFYRDLDIVKASAPEELPAPPVEPAFEPHQDRALPSLDRLPGVMGAAALAALAAAL